MYHPEPISLTAGAPVRATKAPPFLDIVAAGLLPVSGVHRSVSSTILNTHVNESGIVEVELEDELLDDELLVDDSELWLDILD